MNPVNAWTAVVFVATAALTALACASMSAMPGMAMPGGWTMTMAWMRMPGQSWAGFAGAFLGMWALMMVAMMMPVLRPVLARHHGVPRDRAGPLTFCVAAGYFAVWAASGLLVLPLGLAYAELAMRMPALARATPMLAAGVLIAAGVAQLSAWKVRRLACCRPSSQALPVRPSLRSAWRQGVNTGLRCCYCCAPLTAVLLVIGVMDLLAMALVTLAISAERLMREPRYATRATGAGLVFMGAGMLVAATAA